MFCHTDKLTALFRSVAEPIGVKDEVCVVNKFDCIHTWILQHPHPIERGTEYEVFASIS